MKSVSDYSTGQFDLSDWLITGPNRAINDPNLLPCSFF